VTGPKPRYSATCAVVVVKGGTWHRAEQVNDFLMAIIPLQVGLHLGTIWFSVIIRFFQKLFERFSGKNGKSSVYFKYPISFPIDAKPSWDFLIVGSW